MAYELLPDVKIEGLSKVTARTLKALTELGLYNNGDDVVKVADIYQDKESLMKMISTVFPPMAAEDVKKVHKLWDDIDLSEVLRGFRDFLLQLSLRTMP